MFCKINISSMFKTDKNIKYTHCSSCGTEMTIDLHYNNYNPNPPPPPLCAKCHWEKNPDGDFRLPPTFAKNIVK